jgi:hypothetical protein
VDPVSTSNVFSVAQGDFNRDGKPDLILGGGSIGTTITLRPGNGDGTFGAALTVGQADSSEVMEVVAADVNADGKLDVVALCIGGTFDVFFGNGDGTFQPSVGPYYGDGFWMLRSVM